jgi:hypothetical protein
MTVQDLINILSSFDSGDAVFLEHFEDGDIPVADVERREVTDGPDRGQEAVFITAPPRKPLPLPEKLSFPRPFNHRAGS